jgi:hypothetical protein
MPVMMARNNQDGPTVLSSDPKGTHYVEWQGKGDPSGGDIQPVPEEIQNTVQFQRCVRRGIFTLLDESEDTGVISEAMERQQEAWDYRQGSTQATAAQVIDQQANNDIIALTCVGPSSRGDASTRCGADVNVRDKNKDDRPPLCNAHADLAPQFIPEEIIVDGKPRRTWTRMQMGARQRME